MEFNVQIHPNKIRQVLFLVFILFLTVILYLQFDFMLPAFMGAITLYSLLRKPMIRMTLHWKWKSGLASLALMLLSLIIIILPFYWIVTILADRITPFIKDPSAINHFFSQINTYLQHRFHIDILNDQNLSKVTNGITNIAPKLLGSTLNMLTNLVIMYFILYFMLTNISKFEAWIRDSLPMKQDNKLLLLNQTKAIIQSNAIGIPIVAALQGLLAAIGYYIFGVENPVMWGIMTGICSVIPFVGTMATWVPIAIYTLAQGQNGNGIGLICWGLIVIGLSDNVLRLMLQKRLVDIHPLITVFGVIIGLSMFGFWGLIFGPLLISLFLLLIRIYLNEFVNANLEVEAITEDKDNKKDK